MPTSVSARATQKEQDWHPIKDPVVVGKDILELLSSSMYVDPMTIYREYVQNAADAIDVARKSGNLTATDKGTVEIFVDATFRSIRIRDNGSGIDPGNFSRRLTSFGASAKRGSGARG